MFDSFDNAPAMNTFLVSKFENQDQIESTYGYYFFLISDYNFCIFMQL